MTDSRFCANCGVSVSKSLNFCTSCGTEVSKTPAQCESSETHTESAGTLGEFSKKEESPRLVEEYSVRYLGGHPAYAKSKIGKITFQLFDDRFEFHPTIGTKDWFDALTIPYSDTHDLEIVQRQVGTVEGILGGLDSRQLNQANNIQIQYDDSDGTTILIRLEMLTGFTVMRQAAKCRELADRLSVNSIRSKFKSKEGASNNAAGVPELLEKLASLMEKGILTQEEFDQKKKELLAKI